MAAKYKVRAMLKGRVKTGRSHLLSIDPKALDRTGLRREGEEKLFYNECRDETSYHFNHKQAKPFLSETSDSEYCNLLLYIKQIVVGCCLSFFNSYHIHTWMA